MPFYNHIWPFFANHMGIFHKTEIQTVILRCLMSLNLNWYKSYGTKCKNSKNPNLCFWTKLQKNWNGNICALCHNLWTNQNLLEFRPVKHLKMTVWISVLWKIPMWLAKKWPDMVVKWSFISCYFLGARRTCFWPQVTSEAINFEPIKY